MIKKKYAVIKVSYAEYKKQIYIVFLLSGLSAYLQIWKTENQIENPAVSFSDTEEQRNCEDLLWFCNVCKYIAY